MKKIIFFPERMGTAKIAHYFDEISLAPGENIKSDDECERIVNNPFYPNYKEVGAIDIEDMPEEETKSSLDLASMPPQKAIEWAKTSSDVEQLKAALQAEKRATVKAAINNRIEDLEEEES